MAKRRRRIPFHAGGGTETFMGRPLTARAASRNKLALTPKNIMGQQTNKIQKRRRRLAYLERQKTKALIATVRKPVKKKAPAKKKAEKVEKVEAAAPAAE